MGDWAKRRLGAPATHKSHQSHPYAKLHALSDENNEILLLCEWTVRINLSRTSSAHSTYESTFVCYLE